MYFSFQGIFNIEEQLRCFCVSSNFNILYIIHFYVKRVVEFYLYVLQENYCKGSLMIKKGLNTGFKYSGHSEL